MGIPPIVPLAIGIGILLVPMTLDNIQIPNGSVENNPTQTISLKKHWDIANFDNYFFTIGSIVMGIAIPILQKKKKDRENSGYKTSGWWLISAIFGREMKY